MLYKSAAGIYDSFMAPMERAFLDRWRSEVASLLPNGGSILEVGAGTGLNFAHYPRCEHAVASDYSAEMLARARVKNSAPDLIRANAQALPFPDDKFDAAFATLLFCSVADPIAGFRELMRVVKPGGAIILLEHVRPKGLLGYLFDVFNLATVALIDDHFNRRTADLAKEAGINVEEVRSKAFGTVNLIVGKS